MAALLKFGRNVQCPCGSGKKYKHCCWNDVDWPHVANRGMTAAIRHLSARGKNMLFLNRLGSILQLDRLEGQAPDALKRAFSPSAVRQIYEAVAEIWPTHDDLERVLRREAAVTSGLYVGNYEPELISQAVTRHTLYSESLLLVDPFTHPRKVRDEYSPILHSEKYRPTALRCALFWLQMAEWIDAGIVRIIRTPGDLDPRIEHESNDIQTRRFNTYPELASLIKKSADEEFNASNPLLESLVLLHQSDEELRGSYVERFPGSKPADVDAFISHIHERRRRNPHYMEPMVGADGKVSQLFVSTSGASYDMAKRIASLTNSHLITDLPSRWKEVELDRAEAGIDAGNWSAFAKAFQNVSIQYLDNVPLDMALRLRREDRLHQLRSFLRKVWITADPAASYAPAAAENLSAELHERIREAEDEWAKIDRDLIRWLSGIGAIAAPFVVKSGAEWIGAAIAGAAAGAGSLAVAAHQRRTFESTYPAGFFLKLKKRFRKASQ